MYLTPLELRITCHPNGGYTFYTVVKVYPGVGNTANVGQKFMTREDVINWCKREYDGVPRLFD